MVSRVFVILQAKAGQKPRDQLQRVWILFMRQTPNYYELLKVKPHAGTDEVLAAYHAAKIAISQLSSEDSKASYSILIEQAFATLSDPSKRSQYNEVLSWADSTPEENLTGPLSGSELAKIRTKKNLSLEDVFRITRIPLKYLKAIEQDQWSELPARVYLQGFIKNLAHAYKMPPQETLQKYLQHFDSAHSPSA